MKQRIHTRIFLPVLFVLLLFPLTTSAAFFFGARHFFLQTAADHVEALSAQIDGLVSEVYPADYLSEPVSGASEKEHSKQLFTALRTLLRNQYSGASAIALGSDYTLNYPDESEADAAITAIYQSCRTKLTRGALPIRTSERLEAGGETYLIYMTEIPSLHRIRGKYLISYARISDSSRLIAQTGKLLLLAAVCFFLLSAALVWLIARGISRPLRRLSAHALTIGSGSYAPLEETYSIRELEELRCSLNRMAGQLETAEAEKLAFFQNVSHDLRTPLVSIGGYAQGIQTGLFPDQKKAAEVILSECRRMTKLVESVLTISRLDSRSLGLHPVSIPLSEYLDEQAEILAPAAAARGIRLAAAEIHASGSALFVRTDQALLTRIIQNLLSNALRYAEREILISAVRGKDGCILIEVADDGPGISEALLPHIFDRFKKGENGGFGLGLSIAKSGMEYLGGSIEAENRQADAREQTDTKKTAPVHGAVFRLIFPPEP